MSNATEPAYPSIETRAAYDRDNELYAEVHSVGGLSKLEHAAILLRVPQSGDAQIDAMIRAANRRDVAAMAMQGMAMRAKDILDYEVASASVLLADALIAQLEKPA